VADGRSSPRRKKSSSRLLRKKRRNGSAGLPRSISHSALTNKFVAHPLPGISSLHCRRLSFCPAVSLGASLPEDLERGDYRHENLEREPAPRDLPLPPHPLPPRIQESHRSHERSSLRRFRSPAFLSPWPALSECSTLLSLLSCRHSCFLFSILREEY